MALFICSLNSGSNGNCYYIGNHTEAVLVDAGLSCRETERRMKRARLSMDKVRAIFITHEHIDHIYGVDTLSKKHRLPVYITQATLQSSRLRVAPHLVAPFMAHTPVRIGKLSVTAFPKLHDARDPHSFVIECDNVRAGVFTDIGKACRNVTQHFARCHAAFLEANYDEDMLFSGSYPHYLKSRISSGFGHLSNTQALDLALRHKPAYMSHLFLSHLSENNNSPEIVKNLFDTLSGTQVHIASRECESAVCFVEDINVSVRTAPRQQLSLFEA